MKLFPMGIEALINSLSELSNAHDDSLYVVGKSFWLQKIPKTSFLLITYSDSRLKRAREMQ